MVRLPVCCKLVFRLDIASNVLARVQTRIDGNLVYFVIGALVPDAPPCVFFAFGFGYASLCCSLALRLISLGLLKRFGQLVCGAYFCESWPGEAKNSVKTGCFTVFCWFLCFP